MRVTRELLFLEHKGVKVYNTWKNGSFAYYNYSTREDRSLDLHEEDFDVRQLPEVVGMNAKTLYFSSRTARPDHVVIIRAAIDQGVIKAHSKN